MPDTINAPGRISSLKSRIKTFLESNRFTSEANINRGERGNLRLIKNYLDMKRDPDIIVFHETSSCFHYYQLKKGESIPKTVMFIHGDGTDDGMFRKSHPALVGISVHKKILNNLEYTYKHADQIVFISDLARQRFCKAHPKYGMKAVSFVNGIDDLELFQDVSPSTHHNYRLVSTGSVCERKGQYIVIEAMHRMRPDILDETHFTIIGTVPDRSLLVNRVKEYGLENNVSFVGNIPNKDVPQYLAAENIYILMSNNEGLPISILEAMRSGLPIISTPVAGIPEEVNEKNGILVNPDVEQLTGILNRIQDYDWALLGKNSRVRFEQEFTFEIMRNHYGDLFDELSDTK